MANLDFLDAFKALYPEESFTIEIKYKEEFASSAVDLYNSLADPYTGIPNSSDIEINDRTVKVTVDSWAGVLLLQYNLGDPKLKILKKNR